MAHDGIHKQQFRIRDLTTRSVLLFPTRAQIIRDIKEITLQPGANQIVIDGLAPTVDEHSIKVEGTGAATITDVAVDLLPNREVYEDIYPSDSEEEDEDDDEDESEVENDAMKAVADKIKRLNTDLLHEQETINSAASRLSFCDNFGRSVTTDRPPPNDLEKLLKAYNEERVKIYKDHESSTSACESIREELDKTEKEKTKLAKDLVKANEKKEKEEAKRREKNVRKKAEICKEKQRVKAERESFWPKKGYKITINLEPSTLTPGSSRRSSVDDGDTLVNLATTTFHEPSAAPAKSGEISLSLSYITYSASWSPRYDLSLSTMKGAGLLEYGAELKNTTSETWRDAKVVLSTSQTTFSGLSETIPIMQPWHVRLIKALHGNIDDSLMSQSEVAAKRKEWSTTTDQSQKPRWENFGRDNSGHTFAAHQANMAAQRKKKRSREVQEVVNRHSHPVPAAFGTQSARQPNPFGEIRPEAAGLFGSSHAVPQQKDTEESDEEMGFGLFDEDGPPASNSLEFEAGAWEESGMTTTYDVPGLKTLVPSNSTIKHKIAKIDFRNVVFSHIVIGKLRQVAFLKARLRNTSKITLLKGPLGLTLDGSFLGQATFPRCSAGESFSLPLGVDPAINISYSKPTVRRSQSGIFNKEDSNVFTRTFVITNTKHNAPCELTVLDQVPVSEDERLRIEITNPRGLKAGGEGVRAGSSAFAGLASPTSGKGNAKDVRASVYGTDGKEIANNGKWGNAVATAKKGGEVTWNVHLNPGQGVKLLLEYEATFPAGESVAGVGWKDHGVVIELPPPPPKPTGVNR
ncbi:Protein F37C4.5 [Lachnellula willkommii]|uniref:Protein F37C4.5 n=1 Tax=Lachnellula willkommii TaxID=215461 RepID=A0A559MIQ6_9HELO|nr:Protein F37C4.5 [Lachnellula willkommii]